MNVPDEYRELAAYGTHQLNDEIRVWLEKSWNKKKGTADANAPSVRQVPKYRLM
jgi:hypothetical protein